ncbi:SH3 domain-containing protein [Glutamicibacter arilaitensis]|uniref:SH3 domain-containing protein n=1 Tax=Glutamicibacter arilaitensis TaxID=256701 RepID=UPI003F95365A
MKLKIPGRTAALALAMTMTVGTGAQAYAAPVAASQVPSALPATGPAIKSVKSSVAKRTTANLRLRAKSTLQSSALRVIPNGAKVAVLDTKGSWDKVRYSGMTGWSHNSYLHALASASKTPSQTARYTTANLNLRAGAGTNHRSLGLIPQGGKVTLHRVSGNWAQVTSSKGSGWVSRLYLSSSAQPSIPKKQEKPSAPKQSQKYAYASAFLNLRAGAGTSHRSIGVIPKGEKVAVLATSRGWSKVRSSKGTGWSSSAYLVSKAPDSNKHETTPVERDKPQSEHQISPTGGSARYAKTNLNLRSGAGVNHRSLGVISKGEKLTVHLSTSGWSKVTSSKGTGYVSSKYLSVGKPTAEIKSVRPDTQRVMDTVRRLFSGDYTSFGTIRPGSVGHSSGRAVDVMISRYNSAGGVQAGDRIARFLIDNRSQLGVSYLIWQDQIWLGAQKGWEPYSTSGKYGTHLSKNWNDTSRHMDHIHVETHGSSARGGALDYSALND